MAHQLPKLQVPVAVSPAQVLPLGCSGSSSLGRQPVSVKTAAEERATVSAVTPFSSSATPRNPAACFDLPPGSISSAESSSKVGRFFPAAKTRVSSGLTWLFRSSSPFRWFAVGVYSRHGWVTNTGKLHPSGHRDHLLLPSIPPGLPKKYAATQFQQTSGQQSSKTSWP